MRGAEPILLEAEEPDEGSRSDPIRTLVLPLWRSRWLVGAIVALGGAVGLFLGIMAPNTYRSTGKLNLRWGAREEATAESLIDVARGGTSSAGNYVSTELALLRTPEVFEQLARKVSPRVLFSPYDPAAMDGPDTSPWMKMFHKAQAWWFTQGGGDASEASGHGIDDCPRCIRVASEALQKTLIVSSEPYTSIIVVSYASRDPYLARRVVDAFLETAVERHSEFYNTAANLEVVNKRLEAARAEMIAAEDKFRDYRQSCGFMDLTVERSNLLQRRDELVAQIAQMQSETQALEAQRQLLVKKLEQEPEKIDSTVERDPQLNAYLQNLLAEKRSLEDQLFDLGQLKGLSLDELEKQRENLQRRMDRVAKQIDSEPQYLEREPRTVQIVNPTWEGFRKQIDDTELAMARLETELPVRESVLQQVEDRISASNQCGTAYLAAEAEAKKTRDAYYALEASQERAERMTHLEDSNLKRIQEATLPSDKEGPRRAKLLLVGLILGGLCGAALAFLRHLTDRTVRSPHDVERLLGMHVVGVVPRRTPSRGVRRAMRRAAL